MTRLSLLNLNIEVVKDKMTERERLIELIQKSVNGCARNWAETIADYLLENGVIVPPCKVGTHLYRITQPYRKALKVTEYIVKNFRTFGKKHRLQIEVQALNVPITNWMNYTDFYKTKEEAEKALHKINHNSLCETETYKMGG